MSGWWLASYVSLWVLVVVLSLVVVALARQVGLLHLRLGPRGALEIDDEGPPLGEAPEAVRAPALDGRTVTVGGPGKSQLILFVSPGCPVCREVLPSLPAVARVARVAPVVVSDAGADETPHAYGDLGIPVVPAPDVAQAYQVPGTPYAVVTDVMGVIRAKGTVNNLEQMEGLVDTARRRLERALSAPRQAP